MKKSTVLIIFIIYLISIVAIGFFGMASKVYDEQKYATLITIDAQAEKQEMCVLTEISDEKSKEKLYMLSVNFDAAINYDLDKYIVPISLIPYVEYDTGDVANSKEVGIIFSGDNKGFEEEDGSITFREKNEVVATLTKQGSLSCYKRGAGFVVYVKPAKQGSSEVGATIYVIVE